MASALDGAIGPTDAGYSCKLQIICGTGGVGGLQNPARTPTAPAQTTHGHTNDPECEIAIAIAHCHRTNHRDAPIQRKEAHFVQRCSLFTV